MRTLSLTALLLLTASAAAQDRPAKWEYAELQYRNVPGRPPGEGQGRQRGARHPAGRHDPWSGPGAGDVSAKGWDELAESLKAPAAKQDSASAQRVRALNALGRRAGNW